MRISSLLPSATEIVYALGLGDALVGVTHECDYPLEARPKTVLTRSHIFAEARNGKTVAAAIDQQVNASLHAGTRFTTSTRPGPRLIDTTELFAEAIHPGLVPVTLSLKRTTQQDAYVRLNLKALKGVT